MARTKATVRRLNRSKFEAAPSQQIGNKNIMNRSQSMFKIKTVLPQHKQIKVKKNQPNSQKNDCSKKISLFFWK